MEVQHVAGLRLMLARYDLRFEHVTFDFFGWALMAVANGATAFEVNDDVDDPETLRRIDSIIMPGAELFGLPISRGHSGQRFIVNENYRWRLRHLVKWTKSGNKFTRLKSIKPPASERYTVTIRNSIVDTFRNSDLKLWRTFAQEIGAYVIEDYYNKPIHLHDRMALYAGAEMNFGVWSGPMSLITFTEYPCFCTNWGVDEPEKVLKSGVSRGKKPPWCLPNQFALWEKATLDGLLRYAEQIRTCSLAIPKRTGSLR